MIQAILDIFLTGSDHNDIGYPRPLINLYDLDHYNLGQFNIGEYDLDHYLDLDHYVYEIDYSRLYTNQSLLPRSLYDIGYFRVKAIT